MGVYVGIDVSKQHLDWAVGAEGGVDQVPNSRAGVRQLVTALESIPTFTRRYFSPPNGWPLSCGRA